jgi:trigger factor
VKVTKEKTENSQAYITVELEASEMTEPLEAAYKRLAKKVNIPGFRRGKTPRAVLERYTGREGLLEESMKELVPDSYDKAVQEQGLQPFAQPEIEVTQADPLIFKAVVPLTPKVELGKYQEIRLTPKPVEVKEEHTVNVLEELRHQHATWEPVDRPVNFGDMVVMNIDSEVEEKPLIKKIGAQYVVARDSVLPSPGFAEQIDGMKKGEEKEFKLTLPENYQTPEFAKKEATFKIKLEEIKEEKLPDLDDEFAVKINPELKTMDALRAEVTASIKHSAEDGVRMDFEQRLMDAAVEGSKVEYPPVLVEMEINRILNERARQLQMNGRNFDDYLRNIKKTEAELREELRPIAIKNVTNSLVMGQLAMQEKVEVPEQEIDNEISEMTKGTAEDKKEELRKLLDTPRTRDSIRQSMMMKKTMEKLIAIAGGTESTKVETKEEKK